ncbi:MAG: HNH endonuclease [Nitrospirae bacterium]|nr:HNH endonuclease [Nitrospirota bacterium]
MKYPKHGYQNDHINNLLVVCRRCHNRLHGIK